MRTSIDSLVTFCAFLAIGLWGNAALSDVRVKTSFIPDFGTVTLEFGTQQQLTHDVNNRFLNDTGTEEVGSTLIGVVPRDVVYELRAVDGNTRIYDIYYLERSGGASSLRPTGFRVTHNQAAVGPTARLLRLEGGQVVASHPLYPVLPLP